MFLDKTTMTIGPNSDLLIDEFVYDPGAGSGQFAASLTRGALRFVGGQISHTAGATINTPSATIGIRGGGLVAALNVPCASKTGQREAVCDSYVCTAGACQFHSKVDNKTMTLGPNQGILSTIRGITQFVPSSIDMDISGGGGNTEGSTTQTQQDPQTGFNIQNEADTAVATQAQEPEAPAPAPPPGPPGGPIPPAP
jgi:hypothetical protein